DNARRIALLKAGKVDFITDVPAEDVPVLSRTAEVRVLQVPSLRVLFLSFDVKRAKTPYVELGKNPFLDRRVRHAFQKAIDKEAISRRIFHGLSEPAQQIVA